MKRGQGGSAAGSDCRKIMVLLLLAFGVVAIASGIPQMSSSNPLAQRSHSPFEQPVEQDPVMVARQTRALNDARQKALVADTEKLVKLAQELNTEIAAADSGALTPIQSRKLTEIEKLAHSVKDKMSYAASATPVREMPSPFE